MANSIALTFAQRLEALKTEVINQSLAFNIERYFDMAETPVIGPWFDMGIKRSCQQSAMLSVARLLDRDTRTSSLKKFLECANDAAEGFPNALPDQVRASVAIRLNWLATDDRVKEVTTFRSQELAHLDDTSVDAYFHGGIKGLSHDLFAPTTVEHAISIHQEFIKIAIEFTYYFTGEHFRIGNLHSFMVNEYLALQARTNR